MSKLISGKEALIALANGEEVQCRAYEKNWINVDNKHHPLSLFFDDSFQFRLKPRTITINGIEVPAPFEPKDGESWDYSYSVEFSDTVLFWRNADEYEQVVAALHKVFEVQP